MLARTMAEWVARLIFEPEVSSKIRTKHNLTEDQVRQAACFGRHRKAWWHTHPHYGERLLVEGETADGISVLAYLRPIDRADGTWECRTAVRLTRKG
jgi:hypothetical protein